MFDRHFFRAWTFVRDTTMNHDVILNFKLALRHDTALYLSMQTTPNIVPGRPTRYDNRLRDRL